MKDNFMSVEVLMRKFYADKNLEVPKHYYRIVALVMLDDFFGIDNLRAIKRVYNRIRHCRHTMLVSSLQALELLETSYTYTPDFSVLPIEHTVEDIEDDTYTVGTLDALTAKKYAIEISGNEISDKIKEEQLTARLFDTMPETRYNSLKIAVLKLLDFYDKELKNTISTLDVTSDKFNALDVEVKKARIEQRKEEIKEFKKAKKSLQEKVRTYLIRWYKLRPTVNYDFCVAYYESTQKYEHGMYND